MVETLTSLDLVFQFTAYLLPITSNVKNEIVSSFINAFS